MLPPRLAHDKRLLLLVVGAVLAATVGLATAVWGGGLLDPPAGGGSTTSTVSAQGPGAATTGPTTPAPPTTARRGPITRVIQWMNEHGPTSGGGWGPGDTAYYMLMKGNCAGVLRMADGEGDEPLSGMTGTLFGGAASACLAAFHGRAELWPRADTSLDRMTRHAPTLDCESRAVYELLNRLVEAHRAEPSARLVKQTVGRRALACPRFTKITPSHGPAEGGYTVRVEGENLPPVVGVNFLLEASVNHHSQAELQDGRYVVVTVPPAVDPDVPARVSPDGARAWTDAGVEFRYDPPASTTRSTSTTRPSSTTTTTRGTTTTSTATSPPSSS
jgi:IPT/TIG domain